MNIVPTSILNKKTKKTKNTTSKELIFLTKNVQSTQTNEINEINETNETKKKGKKVKPIEIFNKCQNVILHLKCKINELYEYQKILKKFEKNELVYEPILPNNNFVPYDEIVEHSYSSYIDNDNNTPHIENNIKPHIDNNIESQDENKCENKKDIEQYNINNVCLKLKDLKVHLYKNLSINKKSSCFWCSYEYNSPLCYIPKHIINDVIYGYGSFCSPQCAVAYLIKENLDDTTRYERYYLLNYLYGNGNCIKPSPNPYYTLDKYYGNLSIDEYRKLINSNHLYVTVDKPMTRIFPEIHEENEELLLGGKETKVLNNNSRIYKVKMQNEPDNNENVVKKTKVNPFPFLDKKTTQEK